MSVSAKPETVMFDEELAALAGPEFMDWLASMWRIGGCAQPVYLVGHTKVMDSAGAVVHVFSSANQPKKVLAMACGNRRESRCGPCSFLHQGDTYQIVVSGLNGGKGVPGVVASHPRVFATVTAPSFGAVHRQVVLGAGKDRCKWRGQGTCEHGARRSCHRQHIIGDREIGTPLCPQCYDYDAAVLWNAHAGVLWNRFVIRVRREVAAVGGIASSKLKDHVRISFAKVVEFQRRGSVHMHAVIRADGPGGPGDDPPDWVDLGVLQGAVRKAAAAVALTVPAPGGGDLVLRFGDQVDARPIVGRDTQDDSEVSARGAAQYVAKYVSKGDIEGLMLDTRLRSEGQIDLTPISEHGRALMHAAYRLGELECYAHLRLQAWAHQLGFRGHVASKSRTYSTTYTALRLARTEARRALLEPQPYESVGVEFQKKWEFHHQGHESAAEAMFAAGIAEKVAQRRADARAARRGDGVPDRRPG
jgi:hypothetical protein